MRQVPEWYKRHTPSILLSLDLRSSVLRLHLLYLLLFLLFRQYQIQFRFYPGHGLL